MQRQHRQLLILAAIGGDFAALAKENEVVHAVPMLDDVQILLDLAPQRQEAQVIAPGVMNVGFNPFSMSGGKSSVSMSRILTSKAQGKTAIFGCFGRVGEPLKGKQHKGRYRKRVGRYS